jgi:ABC-type amino acid transport substrate-binding protein
MIRVAIMPIVASIITACSTPPMTPKAPPAVVAEPAPTGKLRAVINLGNPVLAKDSATGEPRGVSVDLSRESAKRLGAPLELITVTTAAKSVVAGAGSAYDLYLTRELKRAQIVRVPTSEEVAQAMLAQRLEVAAGVRQQLEADAKRTAGVRLLDGRFMVINQAMALAKGRPAGARYLAAFVEDMKASGFVAGALARHGIVGAAVAPAAGGS